MPKRKIDHLIELVRRSNCDVILRAAGVCDGHTIYAPKVFIEAGLPNEIVEHVTVTHRSDVRDPKSTIFTDGCAVNEITGVYGLDLLKFLAGALGVEYRRCMGRGFQAAAINVALRQHFGRSAPSTSR